MKKTSKLIVLAAVGVMIAALGIFGCSSGSSSASASASASGSSASASATSASASASRAAAATEIKLLTDGKLVIGTSPDYPPFENLENGEFVGLDMEIAKAIGEKLGLEGEFKSLQFDAIIPAVAAGGQVDMGISGFTVDPDRAKEIDFSSTYYIDDQAIAAMKDGAITAENADEALAKATIAIQSGTSGEAYIQENFPRPPSIRMATRPTPLQPCRQARLMPCAPTPPSCRRCSPMLIRTLRSSSPSQLVKSTRSLSARTTRL